MTIDQVTSLLLSIFGLISAIKFRSLGISTIEQRKKLNKIFASPKTRINFNETDIKMEQVWGLILGIIFFIAGLIKFLSLTINRN